MQLGSNSFDIDSYSEFYMHYYDELCAYANTIIRDEEKSHDIIHDVFLKCWEDRRHTQFAKSPVAYFYTAVRNTCYNHLGRLLVESKGIASILKNANDADADETDNPKIEQVRQIIDRLPLQCRRVLILSSIEGMKYSEIAEEMSISVNTVKTHISRAYSIVRKTMPVKVFLSLLAP